MIFGDFGCYGSAGLTKNPILANYKFIFANAGNGKNTSNHDMVYRINLGDKPYLIELIDEYFQRCVDVLETKINVNDVQFVTLGEENFGNKQNDDVLKTLYKRLKKKYPKVKFYQWYSPTTEAMNYPGRNTSWPKLPSDGWVMDHYAFPNDKYDELMDGFLTTGKPVCNVLWFSPDWRVNGRHKDNTGWWNTTGWQTFYYQMAVSCKANIPVALFSYRLPKEGENHLKFMGDGVDERSMKFLAYFNDFSIPWFRYAKPTLPLKIPSKKPRWIPSW